MQASNGSVYTKDIATGTVSLQNCPGCASITNTAAGNYNLVAPNASTLQNNDLVSGNQVTLSAPAGNYVVNAPIIGTGKNALVNVTANGNISGTGSIGSNTVSFTSSTGAVGSCAAPMMTSAAVISASAKTNVAINDSNSSGVTINSSNAGTEFDVTSAASITTTGLIKANNIGLQTENNGNVILNSTLNATKSVAINANGSGSITETSGTIATADLALASATGGIGLASQMINTSAGTLTANTGGNADVYLRTGNVSIGISSAGHIFEVVSSGTVKVTGVIPTGQPWSGCCINAAPITAKGPISAPIVIIKTPSNNNGGNNNSGSTQITNPGLLNGQTQASTVPQLPTLSIPLVNTAYITNALTPNDLSLNQIYEILSGPIANIFICAPRKLAVPKNGNIPDLNEWILVDSDKQPFSLADEGAFVLAETGAEFAYSAKSTVNVRTGQVAVFSGKTGVTVKSGDGQFQLAPMSVLILNSETDKVTGICAEGTINYTGQSSFGLKKFDQATITANGSSTQSVAMSKVTVDMLAGNKMMQKNSCCDPIQKSRIHDVRESIEASQGKGKGNVSSYAPEQINTQGNGNATSYAPVHIDTQGYGNVSSYAPMQIDGQSTRNLSSYAQRQGDANFLTYAPVQIDAQGSGSLPSYAPAPSNANSAPSAPEQSDAQGLTGIAYQQVMPSPLAPVHAPQLKEVVGNDFNVFTLHNANYSTPSPNHVVINDGELIIVAKQACEVQAGNSTFFLAKGTAASVIRKDGMCSVKNLSDEWASKSGVAVSINGKHSGYVAIGCERIISNNMNNITQFTDSDRVGRRLSKVLEYKTSNIVLTNCEFSLVSYCMQSPVLKNLLKSNGQGRELLDRLMKVAVGINMATASHGNFGNAAFNKENAANESH
jgi:hypothetical protein